VEPRRATLRDGTPVVVRPIESADRDRLRAGFERLSPESRYRRFFSPVNELSERDLDYLVEVDHHDHEALLAVPPDGGPGYGVARFVRTAPEEAEPAIVVVDDWQGRGVGGLLLDVLAERAREEGIARFRAPVLARNEESIRLLRRLGPTRQSRVGEEVELEIELGLDAGGRPGLVSVLRAAAGERVLPALTLLQRLVDRRPPLDRSRWDDAVVALHDPTHPDDAAVRTAAGLARRLGARLELVTASRPWIDDRDGLDEDLNAAAARLRSGGLEVVAHLRRGALAAAVVDVATERRARLIVVPASDGRGVGRLLPGTEHEAIARQAPCDVLIVRGDPAAGRAQRPRAERS
jgi:GNAT superfamily N-acetyltransferase/nucleotide-binding universal stress UspA family protein